MANTDDPHREAKMTSTYHSVYENWKKKPEEFWANAAKEIDWFTPAEKVFDKDAGDVWPLVSRRILQYLLQQRRPPCGARTSRTTGHHL